MSPVQDQDPIRTLAFLLGGGVSGELARAVDWGTTPLGPPASWPQSLRTIVSVILQSRHPMFLWWGPELIQIYNDAYLPSFGRGKHPRAMGQPGRECWQEIWPIIWPQIDDVLNHGGSSWNEDHLVPIFRNGRIEEVYWTYGYSPVLDDQGRVGGVLVVCTETTSQVIAVRRSRMMRALVDQTTLTMDPEALIAGALAVLGESPADVPFAMIYRFDRRTGQLLLLGEVGVAAAPEDIEARVREALAPHLLPGQDPPCQVIPCTLAAAVGPWPEPSPGVFVCPAVPASAESVRLVVFGLSPRLPFDENYRNHLEQIAHHLGLAIARINAFRFQAAADSERNSLLEQAPVATALMTGPEHVFQLANAPFCQLVGRSDLVGKTYLGAFPALQGTPVPGILDRVYATGQPYGSNEQLVPLDRRGDGTLEDRYVKFNLQPLRDSAGDVYGMMAIAVDITEQVRARHHLERSNQERETLLEELESASRAKDEFLAMLGHELRNPLSPIATALQVMRLKGETGTAREQQVIERQVKHLTRLVDDLLDVSKITRGKVELRKEPVEIAEVIAKAVEMASDLFEQRQHRLIIEAARRGLATEGDPFRLAQVVANLLTNAARYTDIGGQIRVQARREGSEIVVRVKDNGSGIAPELLPHIFDLFVQGKRSADRAEGGLGLGLTLVKNLVALHGGKVAAHSEGPGTGSEFVVSLPAAARDPVQPASAAPIGSDRRGAADGASGGGRQVLVVDDNVDAADSLAEVLRAEGHEVAVAYSAVAALATVERFLPEIAVLDIGLPVMDGYELAAQLRANPRTAGCRLVALTGYGQNHDRTRSEASGFQHHLVKPVDVDVLTRLLAGDPR